MPSLLPSSKKKSSKTKTLTLEELKGIGEQLLSSHSHINNLLILLSTLKTPPSLSHSIESILSLQSFFTPLLPIQIPSSSNNNPDNPDSVYKAWLRTNFDEFLNLLIGIVVTADETLADVALDAVMEFVKAGKDGRFGSAIYHRLLHTIVHATTTVDHVLDLLVPKYFEYIDVRYFTYTSLDKIAKDCGLTKATDTRKADLHNDGELSESSKAETAVRIMYSMLSRIPAVKLLDEEPSYELWSELGLSSKGGKLSSKVLAEGVKSPKSKGMQNQDFSVGRILKKIKLKFTKAWLSFLKLPLPLDVYKEILVTLRQDVIPYMANPAILCDFLTRSYDIGGVISVMALSGLFILMTQHGLEYPNFYEKLYALLTPDVFMAKHRAVFFQLLDTCLKSSHLPAYLAAAFAKKLSRLSLSVPPSGDLVIIAIIHNLLRRHPSINFLVHQEINDDINGDSSVGFNESTEDGRESDKDHVIHRSKKHGVDLFKSEECDPAKSDAMRSSLWEIDTMRHHYCPAVSRFVASLENDLTVRAKTSEVTVADFSSGSYATIFREETRRRIKQVPLAFYQVTPSSLFCESDFPGWTFSDQNSNILAGNEEINAIKADENNVSEPAKRQRTEGL